MERIQSSATAVRLTVGIVGHFVMGPGWVAVDAEARGPGPGGVVEPDGLPSVLASRAALPAIVRPGVRFLAAVVDRCD